MKGIVVDRKGRYAVVLTGNGSFIKIHNKAHYKPGYEIEFEKPYQLETGLLAKISSIAAVFLFTLGLSYGAYSYTIPYSYVDFDINPSIELTANIYDIIIKTETFNEDGIKLLQKHKVNYKKLDAGIAELVDSAIEQGYLKAQTENIVLLTITSKDERKKEKLEKHMENAAVKVLEKNKVESDVISQQTSSQKHDAAKDMGISPGKLALIEKAIMEVPELKMEDLKDAPVKEIMKHIKDSKKEEKRVEKQEKQQDKQEDKDNKRQDKGDKQDKEEKHQDKQTDNPKGQENEQNDEDNDSGEEDDSEKSDDETDNGDKINQDNTESDNRKLRNKD